MKSTCDCAMPEYWCAECPLSKPDPEMVLVGVTKGAPGYSIVCTYAQNSANAAESEQRLAIEGRQPRWVSMEEANRGIDEFRAWKDGLSVR